MWGALGRYISGGALGRSWSSTSLGSSWSLYGERGGSSEDKVKKDFVARLCTACFLVTAVWLGFVNLIPVLTGDVVHPVTNIQLGAFAAVILLSMLHQRIWGLTRTFKLIFPTAMFCVGALIAITSRPLDSWHMFAVLIFDFGLANLVVATR